MTEYYMEFIHREWPGQQLCQEFFEAENYNNAVKYTDNQPYVGLLLKLCESELIKGQSKGE